MLSKSNVNILPVLLNLRRLPQYQQSKMQLHQHLPRLLVDLNLSRFYAPKSMLSVPANLENASSSQSSLTNGPLSPRIRKHGELRNPSECASIEPATNAVQLLGETRCARTVNTTDVPSVLATPLRRTRTKGRPSKFQRVLVSSRSITIGACRRSMC